ncbi:MAG: DUF447 domain-containing protein [Candidatus Helarchaeota archaeon]
MSWIKSSFLSIDSFVDKFKLQKYAIYETIVSTFNNKPDFPHAAPMGIIFKDDYISIKPYKTSRTYKYMDKNRCAVINFIDDLKLFYIFSQEDKDMSKLMDYFKVVSEFTTPIFKNSNLSIEVKVLEDVRKDDIRAEFKCEPLNYIYNMDYQKEFEPINRATGCVLESIIHSTRISLYRRLNTPELISKIDGLISLLKHYRRIIKKVYPNSVYSWIIDDIFNRLKLE